MRTAIVVCTLAATLAFTPTRTTGQAQSGGSEPSAQIQEWIAQLGRARYADREKAAKQLEAAGLPALEPLRQALQSPDQEIRRRAELLVRKLENQQLLAALLAPRRVRLLLQDVTVAQAVAQLSKVTGYPIQLSGDSSILVARRVTLDTGDVTFWEAARQLCDKAGLVDAPPAGATVTRTAIGAARKKVGPTPSGAGLHWTIGNPADKPTCSVGSVRVRLIGKTITAAGEIDLVLEVSGEPRLVEFGSLGSATIAKALDDRGQQLASVPALDIAGPDTAEMAMMVRGFAANNNVIFVNGNVVAGGLAEVSRQLTVRLAPGRAKAAKLAELSGTVTVQTLVESEPLLVVDKILDAAGKTCRGKDGAALDIQKVIQMANGDVRIQVSMENLPGQNNLWGGMMPANVRVQAIGAVNNVQINGGAFGAETPPSGSNFPRLLDAKGKSFTLAQASTPSLTINGNRVSMTAVLLYRPQSGQGPAAQLVLPGQSHFVFEVPFTFKDVRLP